MKLSTAILLGDTLKKCEPLTWLSEDGSCGCAFGGAMLAAGIEPSIFRVEMDTLTFAMPHETPQVKALWPWLTNVHLAHISTMYHEVAKGIISIEAIAEYCREIEPEEEHGESTTSDGMADCVGSDSSGCLAVSRQER